MMPRTQQISQRSLTTPSKHGCQHWEDAMTLLTPIYEQLQSSPNFFQAAAPPSHSTHLPCVSTVRWSHAPSKSSNDRSVHPPNMDASIGKMPCLFLCLFMSNYNQAQTSSKHQLLHSHSTHLTCVSTARWSHAPSKSSNYRALHPPNMDASIGKMPCLFLHLFMSNYNRVQTSSKHKLLPLTPLT
jgi:hypothetical protein